MANPLLSFRKSMRRAICTQTLPARSVWQVRVGSMRGVKPKTRRAKPAVTQGQKGHPGAIGTAQSP